MLTIIAILSSIITFLSIFIHPLNNLGKVVWNYVSGTFIFMRAIVKYYGPKKAKLIWNFYRWSVMILVVSFVVGFIFKLEIMVTITGIIASLLALITFSVFVSVSNLVGLAAFKVKLTSIKAKKQDVEEFFRPLLTVSLFFMFISNLIIAAGFGSFNFKELLIWTTIFFSFTIFFKFFPKKTLLFQYIMIGAVVFTVIASYLFTNESRAVISFAGRLGKSNSHNLNMTDKEADLVIVKKGSPLYNEEMKRVSYAKVDVRAKINRTIKDDKGGDDTYELIFPDSDGSYVNVDNNTYFVPVRITERVVQPYNKKETQQLTLVSNQQSKNDFDTDDNTETVRIEPGGTKGTRLDFVDGEYFEVLELVGETSLTDYKTYGNKVSNMTDIGLGKTYKVHIDPKVKSGPLFFFSKSGAIIKIRKYS